MVTYLTIQTIQSPRQCPFRNQIFSLVAQSLMHTEVQGFYHSIRFCFLETPMTRPEYMRIHSKYFPPYIRGLYNIDGRIAKD